MVIRTAVASLLLLVVAAGWTGSDLSSAPSPTVLLAPRLTIINATSADLHRFALALDRFTAAGLPLPDLQVAFSDDQVSCGGHHGGFDDDTTPWSIIICSDMNSVYEHELAHAWERANLGRSTRDEFMRLHGYVAWSSHDVSWDERAVEAVATLIQDGLAGLPLPPQLDEEDRSRLQAFELLTSRPAPTLVDWLAARKVACADRPTDLSRLLEDATGTRCGAETLNVSGAIRPGPAALPESGQRIP